MVQREAKRKWKWQCQTKQNQGQMCKTRQRRILCDNKRCNPQKRYKVIKLYTTYNTADNCIKQKPLTRQGEFENVYLLMAGSFTVLISEVCGSHRF